MTLSKRNFPKKHTDVEIIDYTTKVPFYNMCSVCEHTLTSNDELVPLDHSTVSGFAKPIPSYGAIYRLIGDGTHAPTFAATFKKSSASGDYDPTAGVLNLVTFLFDGVDYWYSIVQPA